MTKWPWIILLGQTLRIVLVTAMMFLVPLTEGSHAMPITTAMTMIDHEMAPAHDMTAQGKMPLSHGTDTTSCRVLCLGWVQASDAVRPGAPVLALIAALSVEHLNLPDGTPPSPIGRPPKTAPSL